MPTQKQSVATQQLNFKVFKFTAYYVNFPSICLYICFFFVFCFFVPFTSTLITKKAILSDVDSVMPKLVYVPAAYHNMTNKGNAIFSYLMGNAYIT